MAAVQSGTQIVFNQLRADPAFPDWSHRWETAMRAAAQAFASEVARLEADFPAFTRYTELSQQATQTWQEVSAEATIADQVVGQYQQLTQRRQTMLNAIGYAKRVADLQQQWQQLVTEDTTLQRLNERGTHLTNQLNELQHSVHAIVASCLPRYVIAICVNENYNSALQSFLPYYSAHYREVLEDVARFQEEHSQATNAFSLSQKVLALQHELYEQVQPVTRDLRRAENRFVNGIQAIPEANEFGRLLRQLIQAARQLEAQ
jgi:hypothetical protein